MIEAARNRINSQSAVLYSAIGIGAAILVSGLIVVAAGKAGDRAASLRSVRSRR